MKLLSDGKNGQPIVTFTWNREWNPLMDFGFPELDRGALVRDPVRVTLEETDLSGAKASTSQFIYFSSLNAQYSNDGAGGRKHCARESTFPKSDTYKVGLSSTTVAKAIVATTVHCGATAPCVGQLSMLPLRSLFGSSAARGKGDAPSAIAKTTFFKVAAHHSAVVRAPLTTTGRRLLRQRGSLKVSVRLKLLSPTGKATTRSFAVTLRGRSGSSKR